MQKQEKREWLEHAYKAWEYSSIEFDKNILYISSGALGISFAFIEKIVHLECAKYKEILLSSWIAFVSTILLSLIGAYLSLHFNQKAIENYSLRNPNNSQSAIEHRFNVVLNIFNLISIITLIAGIALTLVFVHLNF